MAGGVLVASEAEKKNGSDCGVTGVEWRRMAGMAGEIKEYFFWEIAGWTNDIKC